MTTPRIGPTDQGMVFIDVGRRVRGDRAGVSSHAGTGIFAFDLGREVRILDAFQADRQAAMRDFANEQDLVSAHARSRDYRPRGRVISFKGHLRRPIGPDLFLPPRMPPSGARIVAFHGTPRPIALVPERAGFWDRFPHMEHGRVGWVRDCWLEHGGGMPPFST